MASEGMTRGEQKDGGTRQHLLGMHAQSSSLALLQKRESIYALDTVITCAPSLLLRSGCLPPLAGQGGASDSSNMSFYGAIVLQF